MPPKVRITGEDILNAAFSLVRERGMHALNARELAMRLSCSTQPIFCNFASMEALREAVLVRANACYLAKLSEDMSAGRYPPYKASGMSYIDFAVTEPRLFECLFMRDRSGEDRTWDFQDIAPIVEMIMQANGFSRGEAEEFHFSMWMWVHGVAVSVVSGYMMYDEAMIAEMLSDVYFGLCARYRERKGVQHE